MVEPTPASSASSSAPTLDPLALDPGTFAPPKDSPPVTGAGELEQDQLEYEPPLPEPIEWTGKRAAAVLRGGFFVVHTVDPVSRLPGGDELWKLTQADAEEAGEPLSRILNRYAPARRLAGVSDEAELALVMAGHMRRELAERGRLLALQHGAQELDDDTASPWTAEQPLPGGTTPWAGSEPPPEAG